MSASNTVEQPVRGSKQAQLQETRGGDHPAVRRLRRRHAAGRHPVHQHLGHPRQRHQHPARLPRRDPRPAGTLAGVSGFQVHFSSHDIHTPGDKLNTLVAMNPAALKTNLKDLEPGGILIVNADAFGTGDLHKAGYKVNPLEDGSLKGYRAHPRADHHAQPRGRRRAEAQPARGRPLQELLRPGPGLLALRAVAGADAEVDPRQVRQEPGRAGGQHRARSRPATTTARPTEALPVHYRVPQGRASRRARIARSPATRRWRWAWSPPRSWPTCRWSTPAIRSRRPATSCTTWPS